MAVLTAPTNEILRLQEDLKRALKKPVEKRHWGMVIDMRKCTGCHSCTVACIAENKLPPGVVYRPVIDQEKGIYPHVGRSFLPRPCQHCGDAPCVRACPVGASYKRPDGIVGLDYDKCVGCRYCIAACPYGARTFDFGEYYTAATPALQDYEKLSSFEYGKKRPRDGKSSPVGNVRKCTFCLHRLDAGMLPACVTTCIGHATYFGDLNDPNSLVAELAARPNATVLKPEMGTKPSVYYLI
ncbi:MAG: 4Fe-4S dicluster domain-containing protein [Firmicutes bacterium]|nr:4Fe-4S dicluster domain-containing protein [Bacillota bacterium]MCL5040361.1 4Fe-4S dicluster domain-containing protein [Bacillota bacterium]